MKKIFIIILASTSLFADIKDERNVFSGDSKIKLEKIIDEIEKETNCKIYLTTLLSEQEPEKRIRKRTMFINIIKAKDEKQLKIQLRISRDLNNDEISREFSALLREMGDIVGSGDELEVTEELLTKVRNILKTKLQPVVVEKVVKVKEDRSGATTVTFRKIRDVLAIFLAVAILLISLVPIVLRNCRFIVLAFKQTKSVKKTFELFCAKFWTKFKR